MASVSPNWLERAKRNVGIKKNSPGCNCCENCCEECKTELELEVYDFDGTSLGSVVLEAACFTRCREVPGGGELPHHGGIDDAPCNCPKNLSAASPCNGPNAPDPSLVPKAKGCGYYYIGQVGDLFADAICTDDHLLCHLQPCAEGGWHLTIQSSIVDGGSCLSTGWEWFAAPSEHTPQDWQSGDTFNSAGGDVAWTNPGNVTARDETSATCALTFANNESDILTVTGMSWTIDPSDVVTGVELEMIRRTTGSTGTFPKDMDDMLIEIEGTGLTSSNSGHLKAYLRTDDCYDRVTYGSSTDLWGNTEADVHAAIDDGSLGMRMQARWTGQAGSVSTAEVDLFRMRIWLESANRDCDTIGDSDYRIDHIKTPAVLTSNDEHIRLPAECYDGFVPIASNCFDDDEQCPYDCATMGELDVYYAIVRDVP